MSQTLYASFTDASQAERAAGALLDYGANAADLSLVANEGVTKRADAGDYSNGTDSASVSDIPDFGRKGGEIRGSGAVLDRSASMYSPMDATVPGYIDYDEKPAKTELHDIEHAAKTGISTTTPGDAAAGAAKGAGVGLGLGVIAGLAAMLVPGVGLVAGSGALAAAIGAAVSTTAAGAVAGGVIGYFKDQGVNDTTASAYNDAITNGGAVLALTLPSNKVDIATAKTVLEKYGAANVSTF